MREFTAKLRFVSDNNRVYDLMDCSVEAVRKDNTNFPTTGPEYMIKITMKSLIKDVFYYDWYNSTDQKRSGTLVVRIPTIQGILAKEIGFTDARLLSITENFRKERTTNDEKESIGGNSRLVTLVFLTTTISI